MGLASEEVQAILEDRVAALNSADAKALAAFYAPNAILEEWDLGPPPNITKGSENIAKRLAQFASKGFAINNEGLALGAEPWAVQAARWGVGGSGMSGFLVYQFNRDLKIVHQWVF
jgi:DNA-binding IclR family transcriptional regulator